MLSSLRFHCRISYGVQGSQLVQRIGSDAEPHKGPQTQTMWVYLVSWKVASPSKVCVVSWKVASPSTVLRYVG